MGEILWNVRWQVLSGVSSVRDFLLQMEPDNCIEALPANTRPLVGRVGVMG